MYPILKEVLLIMKKKVLSILDFSTITIILIFMFLCFCFEIKLFASSTKPTSAIQQINCTYPETIHYIEFKVKNLDTTLLLSTVKNEKTEESLQAAVNPTIRYYPQKNTITIINSFEKKKDEFNELAYIDELSKQNKETLTILKDFFCDTWGPVISGKEIKEIPSDAFSNLLNDNSFVSWVNKDNEIIQLEFSPEKKLNSKTITNYENKTKLSTHYQYQQELIKYIAEIVSNKNETYKSVYQIDYIPIDNLQIPSQIKYNDTLLNFDNQKIVYSQTKQKKEIAENIELEDSF